MDTPALEPIDSNVTSGENKSFWITSTEPLIFKKLEQDIDTDVLVIGGGLGGLTTAYCLLRAGKKVVLLEDGYLGSGETGRTTAHLTCALDDRYFHLQKLFGYEKTARIANSHMAAIQWIENTVRYEKMNCDFKRVDGYLFLSSTDKKESLEKEYASAKAAGIQVQMLDSIPGMESEAGKWCIHFPGQGQFHIMKYLKGLSDAIIKMGGEIFTETRAEHISETGAEANGYKITAKKIVVATNTPVNDWIKIHGKQAAYRTYVIAGKIPKGTLPQSLWWDTGDQDTKWDSQPYHYVRVEKFDATHDLLISGGEDHKVGQADTEDIPENERYDKLITWTRKRFPDFGNVDYKWSGQVMEPADSLAFIGKNPGSENIYIITGDSGNGMTHCTIGGILITDLINGKNNPWEDIYDPSRVTLKALNHFLQDSANMTAQYIDWISPGDIKNAKELKAGEGAIISIHMKKYAVYRDEKNNLHACSAVCPHLKGILQWNEEEKSFDCPVHGSRFSALGKLLNGPALGDLKKIDIHEEIIH
jgi:glycine/D-amino acid oxidase-like deaminating enzyme/nitrite reductase/ring-hydroxylating ferredoxin subunit